MSNNSSNKVLHVPYCYLCKKEGTSIYTLFLHIPTEEGKGIRFHKPKQEGCITIIECEVLETAGNSSSLYTIDLEKQMQLMITDEHCVIDHEKEDDLSIEIRVGTNNEYYVFNQSILFYKDCDMSEPAVKNDHALSCPYIYSNRAKNKALLAHLMLTKNGQDHQFGTYEVGKGKLNPVSPVLEVTAAIKNTIFEKGVAIEIAIDKFKKTGIVQSTDSDSQPGRFLRRNSKIDEKFRLV